MGILSKKSVVIGAAIGTAVFIAGALLTFALPVGAQTVSGLSCSAFTKNLTIGNTGSDVNAVQKFLNSVEGTQLATVGAGSPGNETNYFGSLSRAAVSKFQQKYGITPTAGYWGPISRAKATELCAATGGATGGTTGGTTTPVVTPTSGGLSVGTAIQPENSLAPGGTSRVPFTTFTLTNNTGAAVTVNGVTVQRSGLAVDAVFSGVVLVDEQGLQLDIAKTLNSNHQATIGGVFTLNAGQKKTLTVAGNLKDNTILSAYTGQIVSLTVVGVNTPASVSGNLPITGAQRTIVSSLVVGSVTPSISSLDPNSAQSKNIGDTNLKFSAVRLTAGSAEDVRLFSIRWRLNGTVSANDLSNVVMIVNDTTYPTTVSADGRYYTSVFSGGVLVTKGNSLEVALKGDVTGSNASGRTVQFDIDKTSDVYFVGQLYGYGIGLASVVSGSQGSTGTSLITANTPWFDGSQFTLTGASVTTVAKATSVPAQSVAVNVSSQTLGGYVTDFSGEEVSVQTSVFTINTAQTGNITGVSIYNENGFVVAGPVDAVSGSLTFTDTITYPLGKHTYTLKGKLPSTYTNGGTVSISTNPSAWTGVTGQVTGNTVPLSVSTFTMNTMTVRGATLSVGLSTTPSAQTIVAGGQSVVFANIQLDASQSGEDIRINSIPLHVTQANVAAGNSVTNLTTCQISDANGSILNYGPNVVNSLAGEATSTNSTSNTKTFSFNNSLAIPKGSVAVLTLKCNVGSGATAGDSYQVKMGGDTLSFTGVSSGNSANAVVLSSQAGRQTIASAGVVQVGNDSSSPSYAINAGGTTGVIAGVAKFRPSNEAVSLTKVGLTLVNGTYAATGAQNIITANIFNGSTLVGTAIFTGSSVNATSTLFAPVLLAKDVDTKLTVKVDLADVGVSQSGSSGDLVKVDVSSFEGSGVSSGTTVSGNSATSFSGIRLFNTYPTFAQVNLPTTGSGSAVAGKLIRFAITANSAGDVGINKFTFSVATSSGVSIAGLGLYAYTDSAFSTPVSGQGSSGQIGSSVTATSSNPLVIAVANAASPIEVPAGQTYYFELRGSVGGVVSGSSITTTLLGDSAFSGMLAANSVAGNLVWSPNSVNTSVGTDADWTNGASIVGLPSGGLYQTVTQ